jgi:hypothetical protein
MSTLVKAEMTPEPVGVKVSSHLLSVTLADGRTISVPLEWFPRLWHGTASERRRFELGRIGIHWPDLNEDISVAGLLNGERSGESRKSLDRWLQFRARGEREPIPSYPLPAWARATLKRNTKKDTKRTRTKQ